MEQPFRSTRKDCLCKKVFISSQCVTTATIPATTAATAAMMIAPPAVTAAAPVNPKDVPILPARPANAVGIVDVKNVVIGVRIRDFNTVGSDVPAQGHIC